MIPKSELRTKKYLKDRGYFFIRAGRSFGLFDFIALNHKEGILIQAKCVQGPRKRELEALIAFKSYPKGIRKEVWLWKAYDREPRRQVLS